MLTYRFLLGSLLLCEFGCQAKLDLTGFDAGAVTGGSDGGANALGDSQAIGGAVASGGIGGSNGGFSGFGGALSDGDGDSTLSGGASAVTAEPCDADADVCESPVALVSDLDDPCALALDATYVYWADCTGGGLKRVSIDGGSPTTVATGERTFDYLAVDAKYAYWVNSAVGHDEVRKVPLNGGPPTTLASGLAITGLAVGTTSVVFTNYTGCVNSSTGHVGYDLISVPIEGGTPTTLFSDYSEEASATTVTIHDANVYWTHARSAADICQYSGGMAPSPPPGAVFKIALSGGAPTILASGVHQPFSIAVDDTNVYWTDDYVCTVMSVPIDGGTPIPLASCANQPYGGFNVAVDDSFAYWAVSNYMEVNGRSSVIQRVPRGGGSPKILVSMRSLVGFGFVLDATNLYWLDFGDGTRETASLMKLRLH